MRFRQLDLVRYGGFADRSFDFGDGSVDLHLVVGPNEAGKSTTLQAIGDFLFGIPGQSSQNWRYDYAQLRLRAVVEHDGELLAMTRRKGNRDTLLDADGAPFASDPLATLLGGMDRTGFERMFGLDHAKLRLGGESILNGRDDAARITLEAGTGVSHIGVELASLSEAASALFKPGGQIPLVNRLMRERADALARVRQTSITDADWTQSRQRRSLAEERRAALIEEAGDLDREQARLDRIGRARAPSARLASAREELARVAALPEMPLDSAARLAAAEAELRAAGELRAQLDGDLLRIDAAVVGVTAPGAILAHRERIEALDERRPVIAKAATDLERRRAELDRVDARIASARAEARISADGALPTAGWRRRASAHLDVRRQAEAREAVALKRRVAVERDRERIARELASLESGDGMAELTAALALLPPDGDQRLSEARAERDRKRTLAADRLMDLAPWIGSAATLATLLPPTETEASEVRRARDAALAGAAAARKDAETAENNLIRARARIAALVADGQLPTIEAIAAARRTRDEFVGRVLDQLARPGTSGDLAAGRGLAEAVAEADRLVDRRDAEAARVAEHGLMLATSEEAADLVAASRDREARCLAEIEEVDKAWAARLTALGFETTMLPADLTGWLSKRSAALEAHWEGDAAERTLEDLRARTEIAHVRISQCLAACGGGDVDPGDPTLISRASARLAGLGADAARRAGLQGEQTSVAQALAELREEHDALELVRSGLQAELTRLIAEAGLPDDADGDAVADALETFGRIIEETGAREGLQRQVVAMREDLDAFEAELDDVLRSLGIPRRGDAVDQARELALSLRSALRGEEALAAHAEEHGRVTVELERVGRRLAVARTTLAALMEAAGCGTVPELERILAGIGLRNASRSAERDALGELAGADNGAGLVALALEIADLPIEEEEAARSRIESRRRELAAERESVGRVLNAAEEEVGRAASESAAADAQQVATEAAAALAQAAEEHIQAATAAALLRWMLDRHRATNQAPLIARAGALFEQVTDGAFTGLRIGYASDDRPVILAVRTGGEEVRADALSEGTRDQLYLALRLASIEQRGAAGSLPIVCDDLLITADDARSAALLKVLAAASSHGQVIVFSHHAHLVEIARKAVGPDRFRLHMLEPIGVAA